MIHGESCNDKAHETYVFSVVNFDGVLRNLLDDDLSFMAIYPYPIRKKKKKKLKNESFHLIPLDREGVDCLCHGQKCRIYIFTIQPRGCTIIKFLFVSLWLHYYDHMQVLKSSRIGTILLFFRSSA